MTKNIQFSFHENKTGDNTGNKKDDKAAIIEHVVQIFEAYLNEKREIIRSTHSDDWTGFMIPSKKMIRGIDGYMKNADIFLETKKMTRYNIDDTDIQVYGNIAILYYRARFWAKDKGGDAEEMVEIRSVDIYKKENNHWNQIGSNICKMPE